MRKILLIIVVATIFTACKQYIRDEDFNKLNGYWEIEKVVLKDGEKKDYKVNETIDYFEVKDNKGFRTKVMPQLDGTYLTNTLKEEIVFTREDNICYLNYTTKFGKWKEEILEIKDSVLVLLNKDKLEYHYKRHVPFSLK